MFGFFKSKSLLKSEMQKRAEALEKTKKVQLEPQKLSEVENKLDNDIRSMLEYSPVNYYATKNRFMQCTFYYDRSYEEIYMRLETYVMDSCTERGSFRKIDYELMKLILRKFGVMI